MAVAVLPLLVARPAAAFRDLKIGEPLADRELPTLDGGRAPLLGSARASVFVFFRPAHDHSVDTLRQLAQLERELAGRPVRFVAVTSDRYHPDDVRAAVREAGVRMPVLVDVADALYGELGVALHPVVGITDGAHRLAAYEHFRQVNQLDVLRGRIQRVLGDIDDAQMARLVAPPRATTGDGITTAARRRLQLARALLVRGHAALAEENARLSIADDPAFAPARAVLARALAAQGRCADARAALAEALRLDAADADARQGVPECGAR